VQLTQPPRQVSLVVRQASRTRWMRVKYMLAGETFVADKSGRYQALRRNALKQTD
jgi:hypothetical protein